MMVKDLTMVDLIKWYIRWKSLTAVSASAMEKVEPLACRGRTELHGVSSIKLSLKIIGNS